MEYARLGRTLGPRFTSLYHSSRLGRQAHSLVRMEFHQEYLDLKPLERIIKCVIALYRMYDEALDELDKLRHSQIKFVCFEHVAVDPVTELTQISDWLDTTLHPEMSTAMER